MRFYICLLISFLSVTVSYSQEFLKHSTIHFKDSTSTTADFYYYPTLPQSVTLVDSLGAKHTYNLSWINYVEGPIDIFRVMDFEGKPMLFETVAEGKKASLYKTSYNGDLQMYVLKNGKMYWLHGGKIEFKRGDQTFTKDNDQYKGLLKYLFSDNEYVVKNVDKASYSLTDMLPLILGYNNGQVSFIKTEEMERQNRKPDNKLYIQYSSCYNVEPFPLTDISSSRYFQMGNEVYLSQGSRHSFKFGIEYAHFKGLEGYTYKNYLDKNWLILNAGYYYDIYKRPYTNIYLGASIVGMGAVWDLNESGFYIIPRLSPLFGIEQHLDDKLSIFIEINNLLRGGGYGRNLTFGLTFDI